jgi:hypothetical protein
VKRTVGWVTSIVLGLAFATPTLLCAGSKTQHAEVPQEVQKSSKQYQKQLKKQQKQTAKLQKKQTKQNRKRVQTTHSVTG